MRKFGVNTISNIIARLWSLISIYIFIPLYIRFMGESAYGLVSFFATLQTTMNLLGLGLSNTLRREFAVGNVNEENAIRKYKLLRSVELIYFVIAILIMIICSVFSGSIATNWLNIESLDPVMVTQVISMMGVSIALQLLANLYAGCLFGLENQVLANMICVAWSFLKYVGSLGLLIIFSSDLRLFYGWHILIDVVYLVILRALSIKKLKLPDRVKWQIRDLSNLKTIWKYTLGLLLISGVALINKQLDKIIISRFLTLTELGAYNVATTLGNLTSIIPAALYVAVFPRFTNFASTGNNEALTKEFSIVNKCVNIVLSCMGAFIAVYSLPLIELWTGSKSYISILGIVGFLVVISITIAEYQEIPYALALANGNTKYNVIVGSVFVPIVVGFTWFGIKNWGLLGAGIVYVVMMLGQTVFYEYLVLRKYIDPKPNGLIIKDTFLPLVLGIAIALCSQFGIKLLTDNSVLISIYAVVCGCITLVLMFFIFARKELKIFITYRKRDRK